MGYAFHHTCIGKYFNNLENNSNNWQIGSCGYKKLLLYCQSSNETVCRTEEKSLLVKPLKEDYYIEYILRTQKICIK